jgi:hypothetical protein
MYRTLLFAISLLGTISCYSQNWPKIYFEYNRDIDVRGLKEDYDKGILMAGLNGIYSSDKWCAFLIKTDINGNILWEKKFGLLNSYRCAAYTIEKTEDGGTVISGSINKYGISDDIDPLFFKLNPCGEVDWCTVLQSPGDNYGTDIIPLHDGSYIGMLKFYGGDYEHIRISLIKLDHSGQPLWIKHQAQEDTLIRNEDGFDLQILSDSTYLITGATGLSPFWINTDTTGSQQWDLIWEIPNTGLGMAMQTFQHKNNILYSIGGVVAPSGKMLPVLFKFDEEGSSKYYTYLFDTVYAGGAGSLCLYNDTTIIIGIQWRDHFSPTYEGYSGVLMTDTLGNIIKTRLLIDENYYPWSIIKTFNNKILVARSYFLGWQKIYLFKLNKDLEDDTLDPRPFTYDSLCRYPITSDTIDLNCGIYVSVGDIPTKEQYDKKMKVYPNPAASTLNFEFKNIDSEAELFIYDMYGRMIGNDIIQKGSSSLQKEISFYPKGLFIAILRISIKEIATERFVIQ